jgi:uncharacterized short protein YbdD (DUF466 family)
MTPREAVHSARAAIDRAACVLRRVIGVPDYDICVAHLRAHHADVEPMTREEFTRQRLADRYSRPGSRCC